MRSCAVLILFTVISCSYAAAGDIDAYYSRGNQAYQTGDYQAAIQAYSQILEAGYVSWQVYYNLGNAYYKSGNIGRAILNYERAKLLDPENEDINHNLEIANLAVVDRIQEIPQFFLFAWISSLAHVFGLSVLGGIVLALYLILTALVILRLFSKAALPRRLSFVTTIVTGFIFVFFVGIFSLRVVENETRNEAIVITDKVDVKSAPDANGTVVFTLHEGVKLDIQDRSLDWVKIKLADGKIGWLRNDVIAKI